MKLFSRTIRLALSELEVELNEIVDPFARSANALSCKLKIYTMILNQMTRNASDIHPELGNTFSEIHAAFKKIITEQHQLIMTQQDVYSTNNAVLQVPTY